MPDYKKGTIYKIVCKDDRITDTYIGSSCLYEKRMGEHKSVCHNPNSKAYTNKKYKVIRENGGWSNWSMTKIKDFPCNSRKELRMEEQRHLEGGSLNVIQSYTTAEERTACQKKYYQATKPIRQEKSKEYYKNNQVRLRANRNAKTNCPCGGKYCHGDKARHLKSNKHLTYVKKEQLKEIEKAQENKHCIVII